MRKIVSIIGLLLFISATVFAQEKSNYTEIIEAMKHSTPNIEDKGNTLTLKFIEKNWTVKKGDEILILFPMAGKTDFLFIQKKKGLLNAKLLGQVADIVGTGAMAVGLSSNNMDVVINAMEVSNKADAVGYGIDALNKIDDLNISKKAKKIAGKKATVLNWKNVDDDYVVYVKIGKKKYQINYAGAILTNEIKVNI